MGHDVESEIQLAAPYVLDFLVEQLRRSVIHSTQQDRVTLSMWLHGVLSDMWPPVSRCDVWVPRHNGPRPPSFGQNVTVLHVVPLSRAHLFNRARIGSVFFFFQAEDGIRDLIVTGVQTCALPICGVAPRRARRSRRAARSRVRALRARRARARGCCGRK